MDLNAYTALLAGGGFGGVLVLVRAYRQWRAGGLADTRSIAGDYKAEATSQRERAEVAERKVARWRTQAHKYRVQLLGAKIAPRDDPIMVSDLEDPS